MCWGIGKTEALVPVIWITCILEEILHSSVNLSDNLSLQTDWRQWWINDGQDHTLTRTAELCAVFALHLLYLNLNLISVHQWQAWGLLFSMWSHRISLLPLFLWWHVYFTGILGMDDPSKLYLHYSLKQIRRQKLS